MCTRTYVCMQNPNTSFGGLRKKRVVLPQPNATSQFNYRLLQQHPDPDPDPTRTLNLVYALHWFLFHLTLFAAALLLATSTEYKREGTEDACFGVVSTAFKFLLLKFMSAKVIFHTVFPAVTPQFFGWVFLLSIVSLSVFALFQLLFIGPCWLVAMATGEGRDGWWWSGANASKLLVRNWQLFFYFCVSPFAATVAVKLFPLLFFATCAPGYKSNADLLCGFIWMAEDATQICEEKHAEKIEHFLWRLCSFNGALHFYINVELKCLK